MRAFLWETADQGVQRHAIQYKHTCLIHGHPAVYTRASRPRYAACSHLPAANECVGIHRTARLLLTSAVIGRSGVQVWRKSCQTGFEAGAPDGVCICAFIDPFIHSFIGHLVEPFDNMRSNLDASRSGHPLSKPSPSGDAWLAAIGLEQWPQS